MRTASEVTVLVVDDDPDVVLFLSSILEDAGMNVETASDGRSAWERIRAHPPDLISLDLVMPGASGVRVLHELRKHPQLSRIPVMIVSGHTRDATVKRDLDDVLSDSTISGPSVYLEKPVTPQKYLEQVCRILGIQHAPAAAEVDPRERMRGEVTRLLDAAAPAVLEEVLAHLKRQGVGGTPRDGGEGEGGS